MKTEVAVLYPEDVIARRVAELGVAIGDSLAGSDPCVLGLMKGSLVFMADLIRRIPLDLTVHLVRVTSHREQDRGRVMTDIVFATNAPLEGRDVLLVEDIVDTGITLSYLLGHLHEHGARSVRVCTLVDKPDARKIDVHPEWSAFTVPPGVEGFLVGYGLDWMEKYRDLPYIGTIPRPGSGSTGLRLS
jgi:hypoxanthine phosphoribosyltransferase